MAQDAEKAKVTSEPIRVVGKERVELGITHWREKVNQSIAVWKKLVKGIERDKTLLDMIITAGSPSEAWKIILRRAGGRSEAAQDKAKKEFEELTFEIGQETMREYVARAKALVMKLEQHSVNTTKTETNCRILNELRSVFDVKKKMSLMMADIERDELGKAVAWIEASRTMDGGSGGTHALATGVRPRSDGQGRGGGARGGRGDRGSGDRGKHDGRGHQHQQQQWAS